MITITDGEWEELRALRAEKVELRAKGETDRDALAEVMSSADSLSAECPFTDLSRADAILASDWLAQVKATARAEALEEFATDLEAVPNYTLGEHYQGRVNQRIQIATEMYERAVDIRSLGGAR